MTTETTSTARKRIMLAIVIAVVLASVGSCVAGLSAFFAENRNPVQRITAVKTLPATRLEVKASVLTIDPVRGYMKVELEFDPRGDLVESNGHDMAKDVHVLTNNAQGQSEVILKKHHQAHPVELTLSLLEGDVAMYPIDHYLALLQVEAFIEPGGDAEVPVPLGINFVSRNHVLHAEAVLGPGSEAHEVNLQIKLARPLPIQGFAWFINVLMVMLALSSAIVAYNVAYRGKKLEPNLLVWMSALLFVLPGMRNTLPGVPPLGSLTDFLVFFWVEGVVALCLFIMVLTWYRRVPDNDAPAAAAAPSIDGSH